MVLFMVSCSGTKYVINGCEYQIYETDNFTGAKKMMTRNHLLDNTNIIKFYKEKDNCYLVLRLDKRMIISKGDELWIKTAKNGIVKLNSVDNYYYNPNVVSGANTVTTVIDLIPYYAIPESQLSLLCEDEIISIRVNGGSTYFDFNVSPAKAQKLKASLICIKNN